MDYLYKLSSLDGSKEYKLSREFCDTHVGRQRRPVIVIGEGFLSVEDILENKIWKLSLEKVSDGKKEVFERTTRNERGLKIENMDLAYLPNWVIEEIKQLALEMKGREMDSDGQNFLNNLVTKVEQEKVIAKAGLSAKVEELAIGGLYHIVSQTRGDERGSFREVARFPEVELLTGYDFVGKQVNHSLSSIGTLRGFHVEPWAKLVTVISGFAVSYLIDCRPGSRTFGKIAKVYLGYGTTPEGEEIKGGALFIEPGIGNSVLTLSEKMDYSYVVDDLWRPDTALYAVNPMDPKLGVPWNEYMPLDKIVRSERDLNSPSFAEFTEKMKDH